MNLKNVALTILVGVLLFLFIGIFKLRLIEISRNLAAVFLHESITVAQLKAKYNFSSGQKVRILIVPGHEPNYGGAEYQGVKERDLNVELAQDLAGDLRTDSHYQVIVSRDQNNWNPDLAAFFNTNASQIADFINRHEEEMLRLINNGTVVKIVNGVEHNRALPAVASRLYGLNLWADENQIDLIIHIHFNDYPRRYPTTAGEYSGLAIYVPERQYSNSTTTRAVTDSIYQRLTKYNATSDLPQEDSGIIEEQNLIAIGSHNTLEAPSMLIEYGYIYEPQFVEADIKSIALRDLAFQTYLGVQDFFSAGTITAPIYDTVILPHVWNNLLSKTAGDKKDILALQTALTAQGLYPSPGKSKNNCPRTGTFGSCTAAALRAFQVKYGITGETGQVGPATQAKLNSLYSS